MRPEVLLQTKTEKDIHDCVCVVGFKTCSGQSVAGEL
jgi:hypothetical protein